MERLLADICQESSKIQDIQSKCTLLLDHLATDDGKHDCYNSSNLQQILQIFRLCVKSDIGKLNTLSIDLVRVYIRKVNESNNDAVKEETISIILKCCRDMLSETSVATTLELLAIIVELVATFSIFLTTTHVIEIIEMCHSQIKQYVMANSRGSSSLHSCANTLLNVASAHFAFTPRVSIEDKVLSAIYLTAGQVCHHFTKHRIIGGAAHSTTTSSVSSISESTSSKVTQDFIYLLLYLSKKLECKVSFYRDIKKDTGDGPAGTFEDQTKSEIFLLIKIYNCFYLKCLQYTLMTIPDAWKCMTTHLMEIVCKHLVPILVDILTPLSTILVGSNKQMSPKSGQLPDLSNFGRGTEKLHFGSGSTNKDFLYNTLNYQERQYIYKISLELLRLFGLENSMRPLLEALFHRILLLPPLEQRLDSLIYMQTILNNSLLVLILMSNPLCLFGASKSQSQNLDLFKIFLDAIKESSQADDTILVQLSSLCLVTLFNTLEILSSGSAQSGDTEETSNVTKNKSSIWKSPTVKMILSFASNHRALYEQPSGHTTRHGHKSTPYSSQLAKCHSLATRYNMLNLKSRICGYDSNTFAKQCAISQQTQPKNKERSPQKHSSDATITDLNRQYLRDDFNYQNRLKALVSSQMSSTESTDSRTVELGGKAASKRGAKQKRSPRNVYKQKRSLHLSLEDISKLYPNQEMINLASLKYTSSDSRLFIKDPILVMNQIAERLSYDSADSVFEPHYSSDSSFSESKTADEDNNCGDDNEMEDMLVGNRSRIFMFGGHLEHDGDANLRHFERALSHIFIRKLRLLLPELVTCRNLMLVDDCIQTFASSYCKDLFRNLKQLNRTHHSVDAEQNETVSELGDLTQSEIEILTRYSHLVDCLFINADGIYLAIYSALLLTMKLIYLGYYESEGEKKVPLSENEFIDEIFNYHTTIYLSPHFLAEIYQNILVDNFFQFLMPIGELSNRSQFESVPLVKLLQDIDVLDSSKPNAFKLSDYVRLEQMVRTSSRNSDRSDCELSRSVAIILKRLLGHFWDTFLICLRVGLEARFTYLNVVHMLEQVNGSYISSLCSVLHCKGKQELARLKSNTVYIQMMQMLLNTSVQVSYFARLDSLYSLFFDHINKFAYQEKPNHLLSDIKVNLSMRKSFTTPDLASTAERAHLVLSSGQIVAIKTLLNRSSQVASHCPRVWRHVFDLCKFVTDLENTMFRSCHSSLLSRARISIGTILRSNSISTQMNSAATSSADSSDHYQNLYNFTSFNTLPGISEVENINIEANFDLLLEEIKSKNCDLELKSKELEQVVEYLSWFVGQIFENVALKFNLSLLGHFVKELCDYSSNQLVAIKKSLESSTIAPNALEQSSSEFKSLMLFRLVEVILRFVRNGRPLLHFMKIWPIASSHLVDASTHCELSISKKAITSMHDIINAVLSAYSEPDFFNFNESLFKSYERLLLFELCNSDCQQELLLNSICEFVEGASSEIRSGWRSIFKALRGSKIVIHNQTTVTLTSNSSHHVQILIDTFEAFLHTDNMHVFAYASVDFILCIFHLTRSVSTFPTDTNSSTNVEETFIVFLKYVQKFCKILRTIHSVPEDSFIIAPYIRAKKAKLIELDRLNESIAKINLSFQSNLILDDVSGLGTGERQTALLQLWSLVFDEFATTIYASDLQFRPMLLEVYFTLIQTASEFNGSLHFVLHILNHTVLPLIQNLLSETLNSEECHKIDDLYMFLKSWLEVFNSHIIKYILAQFDHVSNQGDQNDAERWNSLGLLLRQSMLVYIECLNGKYHDLISILALSLLRQLLLSLNRVLNTYFWDIVIDCFRVGHLMTLHPLLQLMAAFSGLPVNADLTRIKVMTTRTDRSSEYTRKRARQIFFVDSSTITSFCSSRSGIRACEFKSIADGLDNRDYNIIIETCSGVNQSLSYNLLISQLHNHLVLLQIISTVLTFNLKPTLSNLMCFMHEDFAEMCTADQSLTSLRPVLHLTLNQYRDLCGALKQSFSMAMEFDSRPGLKFLIQHICQMNISANLYQMSALVWCVQFVVDFALCNSEQHRNEECLASLEDLFAEISRLYGEKVRFVADNSAIASNNNTAHDDSLSSFGKFSRFNLLFIPQPVGIDSSGGKVESATDVSENPTPSAKYNPFEDGPLKTYQLVSSQSFSQYLFDYRKVKQKQSTAHWHHRGSEPQISLHKTSNGNCDAATGDLGLDPETRKFLQQDSTIFIGIWSNILTNCIDLHVSSNSDSFYCMLPPFRQLARSLMLHVSDGQLRHSLSEWVDHLASRLEATTSSF